MEFLLVIPLLLIFYFVSDLFTDNKWDKAEKEAVMRHAALLQQQVERALSTDPKEPAQD